MSQACLTHQKYLDTLFDDGECYIKQRRIGSTNHQIYTFDSTRKALSVNDDKRIWVNDNESVAYGHYKHHLN